MSEFLFPLGKDVDSNRPRTYIVLSVKFPVFHGLTSTDWCWTFGRTEFSYSLYLRKYAYLKTFKIKKALQGHEIFMMIMP